MRWVAEEDGATLIAEHPDCIWEDDVDISQHDHEGDAAQDRSRSRSRQAVKGTGKAQHGGRREGNHGGRHEGNHGGQRASSRGGYQGSSRSGGAHRRDTEQLVQRTSERIMENLDANQADQRNKVFQFAKVLGKCEAVIRTACAVARQAASCFEDIAAFDFRFMSNQAFTHTQDSLAAVFQDEASSMHRAMSELCRAHGAVLCICLLLV